jgi:hypothetical protein
MFVTKFDATGARVYSRYLGDRCADVGGGMTEGAASGRLALKVPVTVEPGWYELRLLRPDQDDHNTLKGIARSAACEVITSALPAPPN